MFAAPDVNQAQSSNLNRSGRYSESHSTSENNGTAKTDINLVFALRPRRITKKRRALNSFNPRHAKSSELVLRSKLDAQAFQ